MNYARLALCLFAGISYFLVQVEGFNGYVDITNDGPCVQGGRIIFRADLYRIDGTRPSGTYSYKWSDNALHPQEYESPSTSNTTSYWTVDYPIDDYPVGIYGVQVVVSEEMVFIWIPLTSRRSDFRITTLLNGNMSIKQGNESIETSYVASGIETRIEVKLRQGDDFYVKKNSTEITSYWFVDCKYYGASMDFGFNYKFNNADVSSNVEALIIASHDLPETTTIVTTTTTTTAATTTTTSTTTVSPINNTSLPANNENSINSTLVKDISSANTSSVNGKIISDKAAANSTVSPVTNETRSRIDEKPEILANLTFPFVCLNSSVIPPDPKKTYGYFHRSVRVKAPISNITVDGTNWIQPWDMLSLKVTCRGSGPFAKCLKFHRGEYNVTGNERCDDDAVILESCNFSIIHYFLEPSVYTIIVVLDNDVSRQIYPLKINIYKVTTKPQLSVIVVPVSCSLAAVVLIIFGVAYYIQSRARFNVEVADFDFGQNNPEMEYKTFTERLRDSLNNTGYKQLSNPGSSLSGGQ